MEPDSSTVQPSQKIDRKLMEQLMFGTGRVRRFTQDSPVLPDVWIEYAKAAEERTSLPSLRDRPGEPFPAVKLLLTPYREHSTGDVRIELRQRLARTREEPAWEAFKHFKAGLRYWNDFDSRRDYSQLMKSIDEFRAATREDLRFSSPP